MNDELLNYSNAYSSCQNNFAEVESIIGLKKNLEFFFYKFIPFVIRDVLEKNQSKIKSLDARKFTITSSFELYFFENSYKSIFYHDSESDYSLPSDHDDNGFDELLIEFFTEYNLGDVINDSNNLENLKYFFEINVSLKDLIYACYIGREWIRYLEDDCVDLLSDYYSEEQLESFKKTLHR